MKQILIADDHEVVRSGLRAIIETRADWVVGGEAIDGRDAVALALKMKPDVAIVDYSMPVMNGLEVSRRIKLHHLPTEVLILTMHESEEILTEVLLAGVRGFLLKSDARSHLIAAIEALLDHRPYFTSVLLEKLLHDYLSNKKDKSEILLSSKTLLLPSQERPNLPSRRPVCCQATLKRSYQAGSCKQSTSKSWAKR